uniref:Uncharacterized protein n=1 Tax=Tetranychus urticae TaxID=32264 RepID=T1K124_TETUR
MFFSLTTIKKSKKIVPIGHLPLLEESLDICLSVANVVSIILFGHRYDYEDPFSIEMANSLKKVTPEIKKTVGFHRQSDYSDRTSILFTMAFIHFHSSLRMAIITSFNLHRLAAKEKKIIHGRVISYSKMQKLFPTFVAKFDAIQRKKRICPGATLALSELFLCCWLDDGRLAMLHVCCIAVRAIAGGGTMG